MSLSKSLRWTMISISKSGKSWSKEMKILKKEKSKFKVFKLFFVNHCFPLRYLNKLKLNKQKNINAININISKERINKKNWRLYELSSSERF